jgi:predicted GNAT superfamily acetyltransferase
MNRPRGDRRAHSNGSGAVMTTKPVLAISPADEARVLVLNNDFAAETSLLTQEALSTMLEAASWARRIGNIDAFIIAFDQDSAYAGTNFLWFKARYPRFVYVDRVVTARHARGQGHARRLYEGLFAQARANGHTLATCEVNAVPPNPVSDAFHEALGFTVVGEAAIQGGAKTVRYFVRRLES